MRREAVNTQKEYPFSVAAIKANGFVFLTAAEHEPTYARWIDREKRVYLEAVDRDPETGGLGPDIETQTTYALDSLCRVLEDAGSQLDKVVKVTIFIQSARDVERMNATYFGYLEAHGIDPYPARTTVSVPIPWKIQMDMIALQ